MSDANGLQYLAGQHGAMVTTIFTPHGKPVYRAEFSDPVALECFLLDVIDASPAAAVFTLGHSVLISDF